MGVESEGRGDGGNRRFDRQTAITSTQADFLHKFVWSVRSGHRIALPTRYPPAAMKTILPAPRVNSVIRPSYAAFLRPPQPPIRSPLVDYLDELVGNGGPDPSDYERLTACFRELAERGARGLEGARLLGAARAALAPTLLKGTLHGFAHLKPYGYAGDFELIERVLSFHHSPDPNLVRWDRYTHSLPAARALRSRKSHLWELLRRLEHEAEREDETVRVLHYRSGPGRELADYFAATGNASRLRCDAVDPDPLAAIHGRRNVARITSRVTFHTQRLLAFRPVQPYRLIWCSILAEALADRGLVVVLRRLLHLLEPGGQIVLCHLGPTDTSAPFLEVVAGWRLRRRDVDQLATLALQAGAYPDALRVVRDPAHGNLYLHARRPLGRLRRRLRLRPELQAVDEPVPAPQVTWIDFRTPDPIGAPGVVNGRGDRPRARAA